jgi:hypothetical protein
MNEQFRSRSRSRLERRLGAVESGTMSGIERRLRWLFGL